MTNQRKKPSLPPEQRAAVEAAAEAEAEFRRALQAGKVMLSPQAAKAMQEAGITVDDMIAMLLRDIKGGLH